jgi:nickel-dependent lactate racemase
MTHPDSQLGEYENNPARQDVEEIGQKIEIPLALNAILNQDKEIVYAFAGDPVAVMKTGVPYSKGICQVQVPQLYDLTIVSPGGHPKDINIYQSQKALAHATRVTRPAGTIILAAACSEGSGSAHYQEWAMGKTSYDEVIQKFKAEGFRIGPHKAFQIARDAAQYQLLFYSNMDFDLASQLLLNPVKDYQTAINHALTQLPPGGHVGILPHAATTIPNYVN